MNHWTILHQEMYNVYLGQGEEIKRIRETIKQNSINKRISENKRMILRDLCKSLFTPKSYY